MRIKAEKLTLQIPSLLIKANNIANTVWEGVHNRNKAGVGENFWQFRKYEYGDPAHLIDWKKSAKSYDTFVQEKDNHTAEQTKDHFRVGIRQRDNFKDGFLFRTRALKRCIVFERGTNGIGVVILLVVSNCFILC